MRETTAIYADLDASIDPWLNALGLTRERDVLRGALYSTPDAAMAVIIDRGICDAKRPFNYRSYTVEQNDIVHTHGSVYRFVVDTPEDLVHAREELDACVGEHFKDFGGRGAADRSLHYPDPTPPEHRFEVGFEEVFGHSALSALEREVAKLRCDGQTCWIDYIVHFEEGAWCAVEQNGERFHHPIAIGRSRYTDQLTKQNSIVAQGGKVFRWSLDGMRTGESFHEELERFFGRRPLRDVQRLRVSRNFRLYDHQETAISALREARGHYGQSATLLVLPTGTGKTHVAALDFLGVLRENPEARMLALAPSKTIRNQLTKVLAEVLGVEFEGTSVGSAPNCQVLVQTNAWACIHYTDFDPTAFDHVLIDEAHHAVAPVMERVIHHFRPQTLLGMTATPQRLDRRRLEVVFGEHDSHLLLRDAVEQGILAPIRSYRIRSNLDFSKIRYNGKDYYGKDLQRQVIVPSRDQLVVDTLLRYFHPDRVGFKNGLVFCVSVEHAKRMAERLREHGLIAAHVHGGQRNVDANLDAYHDGEIQFLTTCSLLGEGWDSPSTSIIVMARPTMSKVLYTQQLGRGTRRHPGKEALYVLDVVDNYSALNVPWSIHALLGMASYKPFANILDPGAEPTGDELVLDGLFEAERKIEEIDIFTFEARYPDHLSSEQLARELFVSTDTVKAWRRRGDITPDVVLPLGRSQLDYYAPEQVSAIRQAKGLKEHTEATIRDDFFEFLEEGSYTFSYKMVMMLSLLDLMDEHGEADIEVLAKRYRRFYLDRLDRGLVADRPKSPYNSREYLEDLGKVQWSIRANPFEKFERKRFMHEQKDLKRVAFSSALWAKIDNDADRERIRRIMQRDLDQWFEGIDNQAAAEDTDGD